MIIEDDNGGTINTHDPDRDQSRRCPDCGCTLPTRGTAPGMGWNEDCLTCCQSSGCLTERQSRPYTVRWTIDVDASSPEEAAQLAAEMVRDPDTTATLFEVAPEADTYDPSVTWHVIDVPVPSAGEGTK